MSEGMTLATDEDGDIVYELNSERLKAGKFSVFSAVNEVGIGDIVAITNIMAGNAAARQQ